MSKPAWCMQGSLTGCTAESGQAQAALRPQDRLMGSALPRLEAKGPCPAQTDLLSPQAKPTVPCLPIGFSCPWPWSPRQSHMRAACPSTAHFIHHAAETGPAQTRPRRWASAVQGDPHPEAGLRTARPGAACRALPQGSTWDWPCSRCGESRAKSRTRRAGTACQGPGDDAAKQGRNENQCH